jgi:hypothetical protein
MNASKKTRSLLSCIAASAVLCGLQVSVNGQPTYSIDAQSAGIGPVLEGDILTPQGAGQIPPPAVVISQLLLGYTPTPLGGELDALSYGTDPLLLNLPGTKHNWSFSVDEFAMGRAGVPFPSVTTEGAGSSFPEAAGDIYSSVQNPGPFPPYFGSNAGIFDGNGGFTPFVASGLNLREPTNPTVNSLDFGDNLDAWDLDQFVPTANAGQPFPLPVYFSLDSVYTDPLDAPYNTGTAVTNGFVGGDVLVANGFGAPVLFAPANLLGLDQTGPDHDDLDALVLWENGDGLYTPTKGPYSWLGGQTDMLLFSVRRNSAIIGQPDSLLGLPIEEGDILVPMGNPGQNPGIFVPAEALGLITLRTDGPGATYQGLGFADDLDALDVLQTVTVVPEPATCVLMLSALLGIACRRRRV